MRVLGLKTGSMCPGPPGIIFGIANVQNDGYLEAFLDPLRVPRALIYRACAQNQASGNSPDSGDSGDGGDGGDEMEPGGAIQTSMSTRRGPG